MMAIDPEKLKAVRRRIADALPGSEVEAHDPGLLGEIEYLIRHDNQTQRIQIVRTRFEDFATASEILTDQALSKAKHGASIRVESDAITILPLGSK